MEQQNLELYELLRHVPAEAQRNIPGGKLKGKTEINPMWRIKALTDAFGPVGIGWKYDIVKQWTEPGAGGEVVAFCDILLYFRHNDDWSTGIPGTGGSTLVALEKGNLVSNDECYKMALTDAISVAAKALGVGADIYWSKDPTKYTQPETPPQQNPKPVRLCKKCGRPLQAVSVNGKKYTEAEAEEKLGGLCVACYRVQKKEAEQREAGA